MTDSAAVERGVATPTTPPALSVTGMSILPLVLLLFFTLVLVSSTLTSFLNGSGVVLRPLTTYWQLIMSLKSTIRIWILHILIMVMVNSSSYGCVLDTTIQECAESAAAVLAVAVSVSTGAMGEVFQLKRH